MKKQDTSCEDSSLSDAVVNKIKDAGFRMTQSRMKILEVFSQTQKAVSATELFEILNKKFKSEHFDRVTVYRILEKFEELDIIHPVGDNQYVYCAHQSCGHDKHFILICSKCGKVQEVGGKSKALSVLTDLIKKEAGFNVTGDAVVLRGTCSNC